MSASVLSYSLSCIIVSGRSTDPISGGGRKVFFPIHLFHIPKLGLELVKCLASITILGIPDLQHEKRRSVDLWGYSCKDHIQWALDYYLLKDVCCLCGALAWWVVKQYRICMCASERSSAGLCIMRKIATQFRCLTTYTTFWPKNYYRLTKPKHL